MSRFELVVVGMSERMECAFAISWNRCLGVVVEKFGRMIAFAISIKVVKLENFRSCVSLGFLVVLKGYRRLFF